MLRGNRKPAYVKQPVEGASLSKHCQHFVFAPSVAIAGWAVRREKGSIRHIHIRTCEGNLKGGIGRGRSWRQSRFGPCLMAHSD